MQEKEGGPGLQCHVHDVGPHTRVGRVVDRENCAWASMIFERLEAAQSYV